MVLLRGLGGDGGLGLGELVGGRVDFEHPESKENEDIVSSVFFTSDSSGIEMNWAYLT